jgi:hypothetical protein
MENVYRNTHIVLCILAAAAGLLLTLPAGIGCLFGALILGVAAFLFGKPGKALARKLIAAGDRIRNVLLKALYYVGIVLGGVLLSVLALGLAGEIGSLVPTDGTLSGALTASVLALLPAAVIVTLIAVLVLLTLTAAFLRLFQTDGTDER